MLRRDLRVALVCGVVAVAVSGAALAVSLHAHAWNTSVLVRMQPDEPIAALTKRIDPDFVFVPNGHYDGVYAYAIALDPAARGEAHNAIDFPAYRYGRPGLGWLAWVFSLGRAEAIPPALLVISVVAMGVAGICASLLCSWLGSSAWGGLVVPFGPGLVIGVVADTSEPLQAALLSAGLLLWFRGPRPAALVALGYLCLVKEQFLAVPAGLILWEVIEGRRGRSEAGARWRIAALAAVPAPLLAWWIYVRSVFGHSGVPLTDPHGVGGLHAWPLYGWFDSLRKANQFIFESSERSQLGYATMGLLFAVGVAFAVASLKAARLRSPLEPIFLFLIVVASLFSYWQLLFPKEVMRLLAVQIALVPAVLFGVGRREVARAQPPPD
jgi:hypothetical protein